MRASTVRECRAHERRGCVLHHSARSSLSPLLYCVNWGFRLPSRGMNAERRDAIADMFEADLADLHYRGQGDRDGRAFDTYGIVYVPDP